MSKRELFKVLDVSTCHIAFEDTEILDRLGLVSDEYGYFVWHDILSVIGDVDLSILSDGFKAIVEEARKWDCRYIRLDRDGPEYDDLPKYNW